MHSKLSAIALITLYITEIKLERKVVEFLNVKLSFLNNIIHFYFLKYYIFYTLAEAT